MARDFTKRANVKRIVWDILATMKVGDKFSIDYPYRGMRCLWDEVRAEILKQGFEQVSSYRSLTAYIRQARQVPEEAYCVCTDNHRSIYEVEEVGYRG